MTWQLDPGATRAPQVEEPIRKSPASLPVNARPVTANGPLPVFVTVTGCGLLSVLCACVANVAGVSVPDERVGLSALDPFGLEWQIEQRERRGL